MQRKPSIDGVKANCGKKIKLKKKDLGVGDVGVLADLRGDGSAKLRRGNDFVKIVDFHDGGDGSAGSLEEIKDSMPCFVQSRRVWRHLHTL